MTTLDAAPPRPCAPTPRPARPDDDRVRRPRRRGRRGGGRATRPTTTATPRSSPRPTTPCGESGYLAMAVPEELGGLGATMRQVCFAQAELARHDGATALAVAMHHVPDPHAGLPPAGRCARRRGRPAPHRREGIVIATSGGSDWLWPTTVAEPVPTDDGAALPSDGPQGVLQPVARRHGGGDLRGRGRRPARAPRSSTSPCPLAAEGVRLEETWDTLGMRGTASHDVVMDGVVVPAERDHRPPSLRRVRRPAGGGRRPLRPGGAAPPTTASPPAPATAR